MRNKNLLILRNGLNALTPSNYGINQKPKIDSLPPQAPNRFSQEDELAYKSKENERKDSLSRINKFQSFSQAGKKCLLGGQFSSNGYRFSSNSPKQMITAKDQLETSLNPLTLKKTNSKEELHYKKIPGGKGDKDSQVQEDNQYYGISQRQSSGKKQTQVQEYSSSYSFGEKGNNALQPLNKIKQTKPPLPTVESKYGINKDNIKRNVLPPVSSKRVDENQEKNQKQMMRSDSHKENRLNSAENSKKTRDQIDQANGNGIMTTSLKNPNTNQLFSISKNSFSTQQQQEKFDKVTNLRQKSSSRIREEDLQDINSKAKILEEKFAKYLSNYDKEYANKKAKQKQEEQEEDQEKDNCIEEEEESLSSQSMNKGNNNKPEKYPNFQYLKRSAAGLNNIGNTCFMNSALQCVMNTPTFNEFFFCGEFKNMINPKNKGVAVSYAALISNARSTGTSTCQAPQALKRSIERVSSQFYGYDQQDAQELLSKLLEGLHEDLNRVREKPKYRELTADLTKMKLLDISKDWFSYYKQRDNSIVTDFFTGQFLSTVKCHCGNESIAFDNFMDLPLSFKELRDGQSQKLNELMSKFCREEELDDDHYCSKCKNHTQQTRQLKLFKLPQIIVVHLKRFNFGRVRKDKITSAIQFPFKNLDLKEFIHKQSDEISQETKYDLYGIVHHSGSLSFGHYTSESLNPYDGKWYNFNDSSAGALSADQIQKECSSGRTTPYILFYCKSSLLEPYSGNGNSFNVRSNL